MRCQFLPSLALLVVASTALSAQSSSDTLAPRDPPERGWVSVGLGAGTGSTLAGLIGAWYSRGPLAVGAQYSETQRFWSADRHSSTAVLLGARTSGEHAFLMGGVGPAVARFLTDCNSACQLHVASQSFALGFSGQAVLSAPVLGISVGTFGALGARDVSHAGMVISLMVGWFGT